MKLLRKSVKDLEVNLLVLGVEAEAPLTIYLYQLLLFLKKLEQRIAFRREAFVI